MTLDAGFVPRHAPLLEHVFRLDEGRYAYLTLPEDLQPAEAARLARIIPTLAVDWKWGNDGED